MTPTLRQSPVLEKSTIISGTMKRKKKRRKEHKLSPLPASLDVRLHARNVSHNARKKEDAAKEKLEKDKKTTDFLANTIYLHHILQTFQ